MDSQPIFYIIIIGILLLFIHLDSKMFLLSLVRLQN